MQKLTRTIISTFTLLALLFAALPAGSAHAASNILVNSDEDTATGGDGKCTLREAINNANLVTGGDISGGDCASGAVGLDTITFADNYTITLGSALPQKTTEMTIDGTGQSVSISGNNSYRVFDVGASGNLTINNLTITKGSASFAGGILNTGLLTVTNSTFTQNSATDGSGDGGAILNDGTLEITNSSFSSNSSAGWGGAISNFGTITAITNSTLAGNTAGTAGGGISNYNSITSIANTIMANNTNGNCDGAIPTGTNNLTDSGGCGSWTNTLVPAEDLGPLTDNGGSTQTQALLGTSATNPAIDAGDDATCADAGTVNNLDQRGVTRPQGAGCDIGAYEVAATQSGPNFVVNTNVDTDDGYCDLVGQGFGNQDCTLREAINIANANGDASTITFAGNYTITLTSALPDITTDVTIDGEGAANTIVQASTCNPVTLPGGCTPADWRVFTFTAGTSTLKDTTVRFGNCDVSATCSTATTNGGNIYANTVTLTLDAVNVQSGYSYSDGGGIYSTNTSLTIQNNSLIGGAGAGNKSDIDNDSYAGGIYFAAGGTLLVDNSEVSYNIAGSYGGGIHAQGGTFIIQNGSLIDNNQSEDDNGGGINAEGAGCQLTVDASTISNNSLIYDSSTPYGGGLWTACTTTINASTISGNTLEDGQGGGIYININGNVTITNSTLTDNQTTYVSGANQNGGGIYNAGTLTVVNSTFYNNTINGYGGAVYNNTGATATLISNTISDNEGDSYDGVYNTGTLHLSNNIIANSSQLDCINDGGTIGTDINNLIENNGTGGFECGTPVSTADPLLGPLADNGGPTQTMALLAGSPAIDAGDNATCADADTVNNLDQRGKPRPVDSDANGSVICDIGAFEYQRTPVTTTLKSQKTYDGWILESSETSGKGGTKNNTGKVFYVGDDAYNRQYRSILSFNTAGVPDNAVITKITLKIKKAGLVGTNPFKTHGGLYTDIRKNKFGTSKKLQLSDFQAKASKNKVGKFKKASSGWYKAALGSGTYPYVKLDGTTQFRLRFAKDDNNDFGADYLKLYSGDAGTSSRPQLIVEYYIP